MTTLFSGGRVIDGTGAVLDRHGVLVEDGRIARVAPVAEFDGFAGETIDTTGGTLLPGLIDCHVHLCYGAEGHPASVVDSMRPDQITMRVLEHAQTTLAGGTTAVRDCGGVNYLEFGVRDAVNAGRQTGPTIRCSGRVICMTGGHGNRFGRVADGVDDIVKAVREQVHMGSDLIKIMATGGVLTPGVNPEDAHYSAEEMAAGIREGKRFHRPCASHAQGAEGILNAVRGGVDSIEHGIFLDEDVAGEMIEAGTYLVPTLAAVINIVANRDKVPPFAYEKAARCAERHRQSIALFHRLGGKLAMGTDAGTPFNPHGANARELALMVEIGIPPMDAITISTGNAADLMRLEDHGRIAEGAMADLLLVDGDPLQNIEQVADPAHHLMVIKAGRAYVNKRQRADASLAVAAL